MNVKTLTYALLLLIAGFACMTSCKSDEKQTVVLTSDCYISYVSLGQMKRAMLGGSTGDSLYYVSYSASGFNMTIDQRNLTIENHTPLPYNTKLDGVLINVTFTGTLIYQYEGDDTVYPYSSRDSIDCTRPVIFSVYSSDGSSKRSYKLKVNVYQQDPNDFPWKMVSESELLAPDTTRKAQVLDNQLIMLGCQADGTMTRYLFDKTNNTWQSNVLAGASDYDLQTLSCSSDGNSLLMTTKQGAIIESTDGITWNQRGMAEEGLRLIGCSENSLYLFKQDHNLYSIRYCDLPQDAATALTLQPETTDADADFVPLHQPKLMTFHQESGYTRLVLVGYGEESELANGIVWSKAWRIPNEEGVEESFMEKGAHWMSFTHTPDNHWLLPSMQPLFVFPYTEGIIAFGGSTPTLPAFSGMLFSPDYGLTWKKSLTMSFDKQMSEATGCLAAALDDEQYLWIVTGQQTWRGRLNSLATN